MSEIYKTIGSLYAGLLKADTKEYEAQTRADRLKRLDANIMQAAQLELQENGAGSGTKVLEMLKTLDKYLADNGMPQFQKAERLQKAYTFFDNDPTQLVSFMGMYQGARDEVWAGM